MVKLINRMGSQRTIGYRSNGYGPYISCEGKLVSPPRSIANEVGTAEHAGTQIPRFSTGRYPERIAAGSGERPLWSSEGLFGSPC